MESDHHKLTANFKNNFYSNKNRQKNSMYLVISIEWFFTIIFFTNCQKQVTTQYLLILLLKFLSNPTVIRGSQNNLFYIFSISIGRYQVRNIDSSRQNIELNSSLVLIQLYVQCTPAPRLMSLFCHSKIILKLFHYSCMDAR